MGTEGFQWFPCYRATSCRSMGEREGRGHVLAALVQGAGQALAALRCAALLRYEYDHKL